MRGFFVMRVFSFALILAFPSSAPALSPKSKFIQKKALLVDKKVEPIKNPAWYLDEKLSKIHRRLNQKNASKKMWEIKELLILSSQIFWPAAQDKAVQKRAMALLSGWVRLAQCFLSEEKIDEAHQALKKGGWMFTLFFDAQEVQQQFPYLIKGYSFLVSKVASKKDFDFLLKLAQEIVELSRFYSTENSTSENRTLRLEDKLEEIIIWFNKVTCDLIKVNNFLVAKSLFDFTNEIMEKFRYFSKVCVEAEFVAKNCQRLWSLEDLRSESFLASSL